MRGPRSTRRRLSAEAVLRGERVTFGEPFTACGGNRRGVPQVADEDSQVEAVVRQDASSGLRWARTQSLIESWSSNSG